MPLYRIYRVDAGGHIMAPPYAFHCGSERRAVQEALGLIGTLAVELWQGARLIRRFERVS